MPQGLAIECCRHRRKSRFQINFVFLLLLATGPAPCYCKQQLNTMNA